MCNFTTACTAQSQYETENSCEKVQLLVMYFQYGAHFEHVSRNMPRQSGKTTDAKELVSVEF